MSLDVAAAEIGKRLPVIAVPFRIYLLRLPSRIKTRQKENRAPTSTRRAGPDELGCRKNGDNSTPFRALMFVWLRRLLARILSVKDWRRSGDDRCMVKLRLSWQSSVAVAGLSPTLRGSVPFTALGFNGPKGVSTA